MNRRISAGLLAFVCAASAMLSGCGGENFRNSIERKGEKVSSAESDGEKGKDDSKSAEGKPQGDAPTEDVSSEGAVEVDADVDTPVGDGPSDPEEPGDISVDIDDPDIPPGIAVDKTSTEYYDYEGWYGFTISDFGLVYSNEQLKECFDRVQEICDDANFSMAFSYRNINTGAYVGYNQYNKFMTCSTVKAPLVKSLLVDGIDLDKEVQRTYTWDGDYESAVANAEYGTWFTARELIEHTILESDNTAYYMLCRTFGTNTFNQTQYRLGSNYTLGYYGEWIFTSATSDDMMKDYEDIYWFAEENEQGSWLIDLMCNADLNIQIGQALGKRYKVAQKYGSEFGEIVFNDCAIVYADSPFVLCIMTRQMPETEESCKVFRDLALVFDDINSLIADEPAVGDNAEGSE